MPEDLIFDHTADSSRRFHSFHKRWSVDAFHIQRNAFAALAIASVAAKKPNDAFWQAQAAFRFAREIERQDDGIHSEDFGVKSFTNWRIIWESELLTIVLRFTIQSQGPPSVPSSMIMMRRKTSSSGGQQRVTVICVS